MAKSSAAQLTLAVSEVREASVKVASAVALAAKREGAAAVDVPEDEREREQMLRDAMWQPVCALSTASDRTDPPRSAARAARSGARVRRG